MRAVVGVAGAGVWMGGFICERHTPGRVVYFLGLTGSVRDSPSRVRKSTDVRASEIQKIKDMVSVQPPAWQGGMKPCGAGMEGRLGACESSKQVSVQVLLL